MSLKGYHEASLHPPAAYDAAAAAPEAAEWDWGEALLDRSAYMVDKKDHEKNHTSACRRFRRSLHNREVEVEMQVSLFMAPPPRVSYFCCSANCTDNDHGEQGDTPRLFIREPWMIATEGDLALFTLCHGHNRSFYSESSNYDYFLYQAAASPAGKPELTRLPRPQPNMLPAFGSRCFPTGSIGILRYCSNIPTAAHKIPLTPPTPIPSPSVALPRPQSIPFTPPTSVLSPSVALPRPQSIPFTPPTSVLSPSVTSYSQARPKDDACDAYRIAALAYDPFHPSHSGYYLCTYDSKDPRWRRTPAASPQPPPPEDFVSSKVITIRRSGSGSCSGIMGWVDLWSGMLLCDVLAAAADTLCIPLHYLTFPEPRQLRTELPLATDIGYHFRDIALANDSGIIRFVDLQVHAEPSPRSQTPSGWTVVTWTLEGLNGGLDALFFRQEHEIHSGHIHGYNLPQSLFVSNPILSSDRDGVLYLLTNASSENTNNMPSKVIALDLNQKMLLDVQEFDRQRPSSYMTTSISSYLMPAAAVSKEKESMKRRAPKSMGSARKKQPAIANPAAVGGKGDVGDAMDLSQ
ncbi:uncharacterized protein LOC119274995 [Triticum dicoccoides]|uniref:uncharacterized protein LOC119274993 n=1 Tax=Triticum dicoccoides TaxID=85692 RepID=UPI00188E318D|nr:uncharacterized protein LOC119274993 [Triticum dicoccoides]XP_037411665.1 uncharacterized protein LOC119274995 [Triticum dicoccoides]